MISELGCEYFFDSAEQRKTLKVFHAVRLTSATATMPRPNVLTKGSDGVDHRGQLTSRACKSATPCPLLTAATARANSSLVCSSSASMSAGPRPSRICFRAARSGRRRKNSRQNPSERSESSSTSYV